jgi:AhpD family alkylhydroperoxidase
MVEEQAFQEMRETLGFVPGFLEDLQWDELALGGTWEIFKKFELGETNIPGKYKHMIGLAVASAIGCPYCTRFHKAAAELFGATEIELQEAAYTASLVGYFSNYLHGRNYPLDKFEDELHRIGKKLAEDGGE